MVNVDKGQNLKTSVKQDHNVRIAVILLCGCVTTVDEKEQYVLHILSVFL
jgi:hypothetical protein